MNTYFVAAAAIAFVVGLVHSVLGEKLIFQRLRINGHLVPTKGGTVLGAGHVRILWASWHIVTVFGWCMGTVLLQLAGPSSLDTGSRTVVQAFAVSALAACGLVLVGTRARHPGWMGLLAIAVCLWIGAAQAWPSMS